MSLTLSESKPEKLLPLVCWISIFCVDSGYPLVAHSQLKAHLLLVVFNLFFFFWMSTFWIAQVYKYTYVLVYILQIAEILLCRATKYLWKLYSLLLAKRSFSFGASSLAAGVAYTQYARSSFPPLSRSRCANNYQLPQQNVKYNIYRCIYVYMKKKTWIKLKGKKNSGKVENFVCLTWFLALATTTLANSNLAEKDG